MGIFGSRPTIKDLFNQLDSEKKKPSEIYSQIRINTNLYYQQLQECAETSRSKNWKTLRNLIQQAHTEEYLATRSQRNEGPQVNQDLDMPSRNIIDTEIDYLEGNIFSKEELFTEPNPVLIVPGNENIEGLHKLGINAVQWELFRVSDMLSFNHPSRFELNKAYFYKGVKIIKKVDNAGKYTLLSEENIRKLNVVYVVSPRGQAENEEFKQNYENTVHCALKLAYSIGSETVFFPPIGAGYLDHPIDRVSGLISRKLPDFKLCFKKIYIISTNEKHLSEIRNNPTLSSPIKIEERKSDDDDGTVTKRPVKGQQAIKQEIKDKQKSENDKEENEDTVVKKPARNKKENEKKESGNQPANIAAISGEREDLGDSENIYVTQKLEPLSTKKENKDQEGRGPLDEVNIFKSEHFS